jgi:hypothetical protein
LQGVPSTGHRPRTPHTVTVTTPQLTQTSQAVGILVKFLARCGYVQGRMNSALILCRPPHVPRAASPDVGQGKRGTNTVPLALLPCQQETASAGGSSNLAHRLQPTTAPGILYMLGDGQLTVGGPRCLWATKGLNNLNRNTIPSDTCHPIKK